MTTSHRECYPSTLTPLGRERKEGSIVHCRFAPCEPVEALPEREIKRRCGHLKNR